MLTYRLPLCALFASASLLLASPAGAQQPGAQQPDVDFNHRTGQETAYTLHLNHGEEFTITIKETCEARFSYEVRGIRRDEPEPSGTERTRTPVPLASKSLTIPHNDAYGGYVVSISELPPGPRPSCTRIDELEPKIFIIFTPKRDWALSFSGGFTVSGLTNPVYALQPHPTETDKKQIIEDPDKRDAANLGIATFVHMYHESWPWVGPMFGLGIRESNQTEYYFGGGVRLNDKATINLGIAFGPVSRLPAGINVMEPVAADINLTDLPTRVQRSLFMGISYSFISVGDRIQQPFAGTNGGG